MAAKYKGDYIIPKGILDLASSFVCQDGMNLCFCGQPIPCGEIYPGFPRVKIILEGGADELKRFNDEIAKNF